MSHQHIQADFSILLPQQQQQLALEDSTTDSAVGYVKYCSNLQIISPAWQRSGRNKEDHLQQ